MRANTDHVGRRFQDRCDLAGGELVPGQHLNDLAVYRRQFLEGRTYRIVLRYLALNAVQITGEFGLRRARATVSLPISPQDIARNPEERPRANSVIEFPYGACA